MSTLPVEGVSVKREVLPLTLRELTAGQIADAERLLAAHPEPMWRDDSRTSVDWDWVYAVTVLDLDDLRRENPVFPYEVQVFRIGELGIVGLMGEPFVEAQLEIKQSAPTRHTFVAHFCNGYAGYVPTRRAFAGGGYETRTGCGSKLPVDALEKITRTAGSLL